MRLLLVTQDFPPSIGGIQTYCVELGARLAARCDAFAVLAPAAPGDREIDTAMPFKVHRVPVGSDRAAMAIGAAAAVPVLCRSGGFDTVFHAQWNTASGGLAARKLGLVERVVAAAHGRELLIGYGRGRRARLYGRLRRAALSRIDRFLPVSRYTADVLQRLGVPASRVTVVNNGVDPQRYRPVDSTGWRESHMLTGVPLLLTLARLVRRKGIDTVLHALPKIRHAVPQVRYAIAGSGPDRGRLEALAKRLHVDDSVHWLGHVHDADLSACLSAADVFVMPARSRPPDVEGFGLVYLEANACGRPVVGASAGGVPDAIVSGVTGELVPPDDPAALAGTLTYLLQDPAYADRLGRQGRERVIAEATWDHATAAVFAALQ